MENLKGLEIKVTSIDENILQIFVPMKIKKRNGGVTTLVLPHGVQISKKLDDTLLSAFAKAYQWKSIIDDENNEINSLSELARDQDISNSHATKVYRLNFISPRIVEAITNGTAPRDLRLQDIFANKAPKIWREQEEMWGF